MMKRYLACRRLQKWLMVDGQWSMVNAEEMEQHLAECPRCAAFLREQREVSALLTHAQLPRPSATPDLTERVLAQLPPPVTQSVRLRPALFVCAGAAALGVILWFAFAAQWGKWRDKTQSNRLRYTAVKPPSEPSIVQPQHHTEDSVKLTTSPDPSLERRGVRRHRAPRVRFVARRRDTVSAPPRSTLTRPDAHTPTQTQFVALLPPTPEAYVPPAAGETQKEVGLGVRRALLVIPQTEWTNTDNAGGITPSASVH